MVAVVTTKPSPRKTKPSPTRSRANGRPSRQNPTTGAPSSNSRAQRLEQRTKRRDAASKSSRESDDEDFYLGHTMHPNVKAPPTAPTPPEIDENTDQRAKTPNKNDYETTEIAERKPSAGGKPTYAEVVQSPPNSPGRRRVESPSDDTDEAGGRQVDPTLNSTSEPPAEGTSDPAEEAPKATAPDAQSAQPSIQSDHGTTNEPALGKQPEDKVTEPPCDPPAARASVHAVEATESPTNATNVAAPEAPAPIDREPRAAREPTIRHLSQDCKLRQLVDTVHKLHATFEACSDTEQFGKSVGELQRLLHDMRSLIDDLQNDDLKCIQWSSLVQLRASSRRALKLANRTRAVIERGGSVKALEQLVLALRDEPLLQSQLRGDDSASSDEDDFRESHPEGVQEPPARTVTTAQSEMATRRVTFQEPSGVRAGTSSSTSGTRDSARRPSISGADKSRTSSSEAQRNVSEEVTAEQPSKPCALCCNRQGHGGRFRSRRSRSASSVDLSGGSTSSSTRFVRFMISGGQEDQNRCVILPYECPNGNDIPPPKIHVTGDTIRFTFKGDDVEVQHGTSAPPNREQFLPTNSSTVTRDDDGVGDGIAVLANTCAAATSCETEQPPDKPRKLPPQSQQKRGSGFTTPSPPFPAMKRRRLRMETTTRTDTSEQPVESCLYTVHVDQTAPGTTNVSNHAPAQQDSADHAMDDDDDTPPATDDCAPPAYDEIVSGLKHATFDSLMEGNFRVDPCDEVHDNLRYFVYPIMLLYIDSLSNDSFRQFDAENTAERAAWTARTYWKEEQDPKHPDRPFIKFVKGILQMTLNAFKISDYPGDTISFKHLMETSPSSKSFQVFVHTIALFHHSVFHYRTYAEDENAFKQCATLGAQIGSIVYQQRMISTFFPCIERIVNGIKEVIEPQKYTYRIPGWTEIPPGYEPDDFTTEFELSPEDVMSYREEHEYHELLDALIEQYELHGVPIEHCIRDLFAGSRCPCVQCFMRRYPHQKHPAIIAMIGENNEHWAQLREDLLRHFFNDITDDYWAFRAARPHFENLSRQFVYVAPTPPAPLIAGVAVSAVFTHLAPPTVRCDGTRATYFSMAGWALRATPTDPHFHSNCPLPIHKFNMESESPVIDFLDPTVGFPGVDIMVAAYKAHIYVGTLINPMDPTGVLTAETTDQKLRCMVFDQPYDAYAPEDDGDDYPPIPQPLLRAHPYDYPRYLTQHGFPMREHTFESVSASVSLQACTLVPNHIHDCEQWAETRNYSEFMRSSVMRTTTTCNVIGTLPFSLACRMHRCVVAERHPDGEVDFHLQWAFLTVSEETEIYLDVDSRHSFIRFNYKHPEFGRDRADTRVTRSRTRSVDGAPIVEQRSVIGCVARDMDTRMSQEDDGKPKQQRLSESSSDNSHSTLSTRGAAVNNRTIHNPSVNSLKTLTRYTPNRQSLSNSMRATAFMAITTRASAAAASTPRVEPVHSPTSDSDFVDLPSIDGNAHSATSTVTRAPASPPTQPVAQASPSSEPTASPPTTTHLRRLAQAEEHPLQRLAQGVVNLLTPKNAEPTPPTIIAKPRSRSAPPPPRAPSPVLSSHNPTPPASDSRIQQPRPIPAFVRPAPRRTHPTINTTRAPSPVKHTSVPRREPVCQTAIAPSYPDPDDDPDPYYEHSDDEDDFSAISATAEQPGRVPSASYLTKILLKHAYNSKLQTLVLPHNLPIRRRKFNAFIDKLGVVCAISTWTGDIFADWPTRVVYVHAHVGIALYNLIFSYTSEDCHQHIINLPKDGRTAIFQLRRHCAPLTQTHVENVEDSFKGLRQNGMEPATVYFSRIRAIDRDCYHAGIPNTDLQLLRRALRGASNNQIYSATYKAFEVRTDLAEAREDEPPTFQELESHLLDLDERHNVTGSHTQHRTAEPSRSGTFGPRRAQPHRRNNPGPRFRPQHAYATQAITCGYCGLTGHTTRDCRRRLREQGQGASRSPRNNGRRGNPPRRNFGSQNNSNGNRSGPQRRDGRRPFANRQNRDNHQNRQPTPVRRNAPSSRPQGQTSRSIQSVVCHICGARGHYANQCPQRTNRAPANPGTSARSSQQAFSATASTSLTPRQS